ncbi:MAG TPA: hypothetical protein VGT44_22250, partial [Ktedonobacteraceae bacterium]|nr:hypothetical protein [Ktedonobacteraceae bacterium]
MKLFVMFRKLTWRAAGVAVLALFALGALLPSTAFAATASSTPPCASTDTQCFIKLGDQFIAARQTALTTLSGKVSGRLNQQLISSDQAAVLQADISTNQQGLSALETKLNGETNALAAKQDVVNVFFQFRIYAVVLPRDYRRLYLDVAITVDAKLRGFGPKVQEAIQNAPASEQAQLKTLFSDYQNQLSTAEGQFDSAAADIVTLMPEN